ACSDSRCEQLVDEGRDRRAVFFDRVWKRRLLAVIQMLNVDRGLRLARRSVGTINLLDALSDLVRIGECKSDVPARRKTQSALAVDVERVGRGDQQLLRRCRERDDVKTSRP